jgi:hypothetical protein
MFIDPDDVVSFDNRQVKLLAVDAMKCAEQGGPHAPFWRALAYALVRVRQSRAAVAAEYLSPDGGSPR